MHSICRISGIPLLLAGLALLVAVRDQPSLAAAGWALLGLGLGQGWRRWRS